MSPAWLTTVLLPQKYKLYRVHHIKMIVALITECFKINLTIITSCFRLNVKKLTGFHRRENFFERKFCFSSKVVKSFIKTSRIVSESKELRSDGINQRILLPPIKKNRIMSWNRWNLLSKSPEMSSLLMTSASNRVKAKSSSALCVTSRESALVLHWNFFRAVRWMILPARSQTNRFFCQIIVSKWRFLTITNPSICSFLEAQSSHWPL